MEQNFIINFENEVINNLYSDLSNSTYEYNTISQVIDVSSTILNSSSSSSSSLSMFRPSMFRANMFRPININYTQLDTSNNNTSSNYLQNISYNNTIYDSSYITIASINNNYYNDLNYPRAISLRDLLRTLYMNYYVEDDNNTFLETFINSTFENKEKFKKVISDCELEKLKPQKFNKSNETETNIQCPILCYNFEENEEIIKLPCNHNYNCEAITKWLSQESNTCPVCRHEFDYKEINIDNKRQELGQELGQDANIETANIYNLFSREEILMQQILLDSYSNNGH
jgi:hypothetical protein